MDEKQFQKQIDILLKQQAATHAGGEMTREEQKDHAKRINVVERAIINLYNTSVNQSESVDKLVETQKETNERLNAVIFMAEKYFSGNGKSNGKSKK